MNEQQRRDELIERQIEFCILEMLRCKTDDELQYWRKEIAFYTNLFLGA